MDCCLLAVYLLVSSEATVDQMKWIFIVGAIISFALAAFSLTLPHTPARPATSSDDRWAWLKAFRLLANPFVLVLFFVTLIDSIIHKRVLRVDRRVLGRCREAAE